MAGATWLTLASQGIVNYGVKIQPIIDSLRQVQ